NRCRPPLSATRTGSPGQYSWCTSTAREQASPTASLTSSSSASGTPLRRATAVATSRAVRTCAGSGVNVISTVAIGWDGAASLLRLPGGDGLVHAVVDAEDLRQPGDPEDLQNAFLGAHQVERAVVGTDALEAADEHPQAGGVKKLHLLHVHHQLVVTTVHQIDKKLTQPRGCIDIDLALDIDDLDPIRRVMLQLQVHKSSRTMRSSCHRLRWRPARCLPQGMGPPARIQSRADVMSTRVHATRHPARGTAGRLLASWCGFLAPGWSIRTRRPGCPGVVTGGPADNEACHDGDQGADMTRPGHAPESAHLFPKGEKLGGVAPPPAPAGRPLATRARPGAPGAAGREPGMRPPGGGDTGPAARILRRGARSGRLMHIEQIAARAGEGVPWPEWVPAEITAAFAEAGIGRPSAHQAAMAEHARRGSNVIIATPAASGKSLGYLLPALTAVLGGNTVLYLAPTRALAADQLRTIQALGIAGVCAAVVDGDTHGADRER